MATMVLGKIGAEFRNGTKMIGAGSEVLSIGINYVGTGRRLLSAGRLWFSSSDQGGMDAVMTGVVFFGSIGFRISSAYFIIDAATNGFGGYGKIE